MGLEGKRRALSCSGACPSCSASHGRIDGSISPLRVPIITPDCGVKPIEVLTERLPDCAYATAVAEMAAHHAQGASGTPSFSASVALTYLWLVP